MKILTLFKGAVINKPTDRPGGIFKNLKYVSCPNKTVQKCAVPQQNVPKMCSTPTHTGQIFFRWYYTWYSLNGHSSDFIWLYLCLRKCWWVHLVFNNLQPIFVVLLIFKSSTTISSIDQNYYFIWITVSGCLNFPIFRYQFIKSFVVYSESIPPIFLYHFV